MRRKIVIFLIIIMIILSVTQCSQATSNYTDKTYFFKDMEKGILAYKQINAFEMTLADRSTLVDASISTNSDLDIIEETKKVEIVFVIDVSSSMSGTRIRTTRKATKELVNSLYDKLGTDNLKIGIVCFSSGINSTLELTDNRNTVLTYIDGIYTRYGTYMADAMQKARDMLSANQSENTIKMVCTLSDGELADESRTIEKFNLVHNNGISTMSIFVETRVTSRFSALANSNPEYHKNFSASDGNLAQTITNDTYQEIYMRAILMSDPKVVYNINNAAIIAGDDKIILQLDEEIMHGATLKIEYVISITSTFNSSNIVIEDFYDDPLIFSENEKLLTENKTNKDYGWKMQNGKLINDSGGDSIHEAQEHKVKLVLSAVLTPTIIHDLNRIGNSATFQLKNVDTGEEYIINKNTNNDPNETRIKSLDILIIPPTGKIALKEKITTILNTIIVIVSILLIIICLKDYIKNRK